MQNTTISTEKEKISEADFNIKMLEECATLSHAASQLATGAIHSTLRSMEIVRKHLEKIDAKYEVVEASN